MSVGNIENNSDWGKQNFMEEIKVLKDGFGFNRCK